MVRNQTSVQGTGYSPEPLDIATRVAALQVKLDSWVLPNSSVHKSPAVRRRPLAVCPKCLKREGNRVGRKTFVEECLRAFRISPWRCGYCRHRFYCLGKRKGLKTSAAAM